MMKRRGYVAVRRGDLSEFLDLDLFAGDRLDLANKVDDYAKEHPATIAAYPVMRIARVEIKEIEEESE